MASIYQIENTIAESIGKRIFHDVKWKKFVSHNSIPSGSCWLDEHNRITVYITNTIKLEKTAVICSLYTAFNLYWNFYLIVFL